MPVIQDKFHNVHKDSDMDGNIFNVDLHPDGIYRIYLRLKNETREKLIAEVDAAHKCMKMVRYKERHFFRADCGYGFNYSLINENLAIPVRNVLLVEHDGDATDYYLIPLKDIRTKGHKMTFIRSGMELQWFMKLRDIMDYRIKDIQLLSPALVGKKS